MNGERNKTRHGTLRRLRDANGSTTEWTRAEDYENWKEKMARTKQQPVMIPTMNQQNYTRLISSFKTIIKSVELDEAISGDDLTSPEMEKLLANARKYRGNPLDMSKNEDALNEALLIREKTEADLETNNTIVATLANLLLLTIPGNPVYEYIMGGLVYFEIAAAKAEEFNNFNNARDAKSHIQFKVALAQKQNAANKAVNMAMQATDTINRNAVSIINQIEFMEEQRKRRDQVSLIQKRFVTELSNWHTDLVAKGRSSGLRIPERNPKIDIKPDIMDVFRGLVFQMVESRGKGASNVLLVGPTGVGKTTLCREFAAMLGIPLLIVAGYSHRHAAAFYGNKDFTNGETVWTDSTFAKCLEAGNIVICIDEASRIDPEASNALLPILDWQRRVYIDEASKEYVVGENTWFFATANIGASFTGAHRMDAAILNRFDIMIDAPLPTTEEARKMFENFYKKEPEQNYTGMLTEMKEFTPHGMNESDAEKLSRLVKKLNEVVGEGQITRYVSHRDIEAMGKWFSILGPEGLNFSLINKYKANQISDERKIVHLHAKNIIQGG